METSLHRELKYHFAGGEASVEVAIDGYRIDAIAADGTLVEVQHAGLSSIRDKTKRLLALKHPLRIIKPVVRRKWIETFDKRDGKLLRRRKSPKQGAIVDVFRELIHFTRVFPSRGLQIEVIEVDCIEQRVDKKQKRWRRKSYETLDQKLVDIGESTLLTFASDLWTLLKNPNIPSEFDTQELADTIGQPRWFSQQIAYTLRQCGAIELCKKRGNSIVYRCVKPKRSRAA